jgi:hypothetical protein
MSVEAFLGVLTGLLGIIGGAIGLVRWLVKHYLAELKPNGGGSVKDQVNRLETRVDEIYSLLIKSTSN